MFYNFLLIKQNPILFNDDINGGPLQRIDNICDLCVIITGSLSRNNHCDVLATPRALTPPVNTGKIKGAKTDSVDTEFQQS